jgi:hypothetical protein
MGCVCVPQPLLKSSVVWSGGLSMACCCVLVCRYALVKEKRALTKFLKCVDWTDAQEAQQVGVLVRPNDTQHTT